jgi:hypothetical protein
MFNRKMWLAYATGYSTGPVIGDVYPTEQEAKRAARMLAHKVTENHEMSGGFGGAAPFTKQVTVRGVECV